MHVTHKLIVPREKFVLHVHELNEFSGVHVQRIVYLARFESKILRCLQYRGEPRCPYKALSTL